MSRINSSSEGTLNDSSHITTDISGNNTAGYTTTTENVTSTYTSHSSGASIPAGPFAFNSEDNLPETASDNSLLQELGWEQEIYENVQVRYLPGDLYLWDTYEGIYTVPRSVPAFLSGSTTNLGVAAPAGPSSAPAPIQPSASSPPQTR